MQEAQGYLFPWLREEVDPIATLDVIGLEAFVPEPPRGAGRPPDDRRALARAFVAKAVLGVPTTSALIERLDVDKSLRRILGWERRSQVPSAGASRDRVLTLARLAVARQPQNDVAVALVGPAQRPPWHCLGMACRGADSARSIVRALPWQRPRKLAAAGARLAQLRGANRTTQGTRNGLAIAFAAPCNRLLAHWKRGGSTRPARGPTAC